MTKIQKLIFILLPFAFCLLFFSALPLMGQAAELYLESSEGKYYVDETFTIDIRVNVEHNESINAIEGYVEFPNDILKVKDFSTGNSILTFIEKPKIDYGKGLISFTGIIPGGYSGMIPGDPGKSNLLGKIIFQAVSSGSAQIVFKDNSQALLSDGKGTPAKLITKGVIIEVELPKEEPLRDEWKEELEKDKIPPEDFIPEIIKINDKYYLAFSTKDKNSGIDHYEIFEEDISRTTGKLFWGQNWIERGSPYLLKDQSLTSAIEIKAIDKAGNEKIVKLPAAYSLSWYKNYFIWVIIILVIIFTYSFIKRNLWKRLLRH